jgi:hypothetical protein
LPLQGKVGVRLGVLLALGVAGGTRAWASDDGDSSAGVQVHGFVSQGAFLSTGNDYLGHSRRGTLELFEAGVNLSTEVIDRLRVGVQFFTRDLGPIGDYSAKVDWAYLDYRFSEWLGLRAGRIKLPFGLYNEYSDIDSARLPVLLPQSVYPVRNRDFLLAQTGLSLYGNLRVGEGGGFDYQLALGTIHLDPGGNPTIREIDNEYAAAAQLFWRPITGLRLGASALQLGLVINVTLDAMTVAALRAMGAVPDDFSGAVSYDFEKLRLLVGSIEYTAHGWLFAAEYARWRGKVKLTPPVVAVPPEMKDERFYGMVAYRLSRWFEAGSYYSVHFVDTSDRRGQGTRFMPAHRAYQRDLALSLRFDLNEHWLVKLEGHYLVGTAGLIAAEVTGAPLARVWSLFLAKTTLTF